MSLLFSQVGTYSIILTDSVENDPTVKEIKIIDSVEKVEIVSLPTKTTYASEETLDLTNGVIKYGTTFTTPVEVSMTDAVVTGFDSSKSGEQTLVVTYNEKYTTFTVTIGEATQYFNFGTNGNPIASTIASTSVTVDQLTDLEYLWSYSPTKIGTKTCWIIDYFFMLWYNILCRNLRKNKFKWCQIGVSQFRNPWK